MNDSAPRRALLSTSDKTGLVPLAQALAASGYELLSTGGTRRYLEEAGLHVTDVAGYTGFPEMLDGRVKTLHPKIFAGLLARPDHEADQQSLASHEIGLIQLVVVNLYPFTQTVARPETTFPEAVEQIDIGGPSLIRAAAKNHRFTTVVTDPSQYERVQAELAEHNGTTREAFRRELAAEAFAHTARYDAAIAAYFAAQTAPEQEREFPPQLTLSFQRRQTLRYGENPHQAAAFYAEPSGPNVSLANATQRHGKELSYNNLLDLDSALGMVQGLTDPACVVLKHNNPCGAAMAESLEAAFRRAYDGDPVSAFGSILGFNRPVDAATAEAMAEPGRFIEAVIAPGYEPAAFEVLTTKPKWRNNVRLLEAGPLGQPQPGYDYRRLIGGLLVQTRDILAAEDWQQITEAAPTPEQHRDLLFAWHMVRHVKSNAITVAKDRMLLGVGAGQMSRVDSVEIALKKAGERVRGGVLASDAFFPFPDSIETAAAAGITAVVQPGGSKQDPAVIEACNRWGIAMMFTGRRHFKH